MKTGLILLSFVLFACSKIEKSQLESAEYKDLIGTWTTDYPNDEERKVVIHKNGKVEIFKSTERGDTFRISSFETEASALTMNGDSLQRRVLSAINNGKSNGYLVFHKKLNVDSSYINFGLYIKDFKLDTLVGISTKIYTRQ